MRPQFSGKTTTWEADRGKGCTGLLLFGARYTGGQGTGTNRPGLQPMYSSKKKKKPGVKRVKTPQRHYAHGPAARQEKA